jgi:single-strand DNA-binding protein
MADFSHGVIIGRLTRDPEVRYTPGGTPIASFDVAVNRRYKKGNDWTGEVSYVPVSVFGKAAERIAEKVKKGSSVLVEGTLQERRWTVEGGGKRSKLYIAARIVMSLDKNGTGKSPESEETMIGDEPADDIPF